MGEVIINIVKWAVKLSFWGIVVALWIAIMSQIVVYILTPMNGGLLSDIFAIVQIWSPFNVNSVIAWLVISASAYITYRIAIIGYNFINNFVSN